MDSFPTKRMQPLTKDINVAIIDHQSVPDLAKTYITVGRESIMRGGELCSGLRRKDFTWSLKRDRVTIHLFRSKENRKGDGKFITLKNYANLIDYGEKSSVSLLKKHFDSYTLWNAQQNKIIFPAYTKTKGLDWKKSGSVRQLRLMIRECLRTIGMDGNKFGHIRYEQEERQIYSELAYTTRQLKSSVGGSQIHHYYTSETRGKKTVVETVMEAFAN
jgi:hypothetical protein